MRTGSCACSTSAVRRLSRTLSPCFSYTSNYRFQISIAVPKPKGDSFGQQGGYHHNQYSSTGSGATGTGSGSGSIADSLPATALAVMVSNASGNPAAGAAVVAEAQQAEYSKYWQQYQQQQQQQYWSHYAAWAQYNQQYNVPPPSGGHPPPGHPQSG